VTRDRGAPLRGAPLRLIYVVPFFPYPPANGGSIRVWHTLRGLAVRNDVHLVVQAERPPHEHVAPVQALARSLTFAPPHEGPHPDRHIAAPRLATAVDALQYPPAWLQRYRSRELTERVGALIATHGADWLLCDTQLSGQLALSPRLPMVRRALCLYDLYDVYFQAKAAATPWRPYKLKVTLDWFKARHYERRIMRRFDLVSVVSARERRLALPHVRPMTPVVLVPSGVDTDYFQPPSRGYDAARDPTNAADSAPAAGPARGPDADTTARLLFVGALGYEPNDDALRYFLERIWPLVRARVPGARFDVVGKGPSAWLRTAVARDDTVALYGGVEDVRPYYRRARVAVAPLRLGAGTKLKVLEALAMGVPLVTTPQGRRGLAIHDGRHALVGATPERFATCIAAILDDRALAARLSAAGRSLVEREYSWPRIMATFEETLRRNVAALGAPTTVATEGGRMTRGRAEHDDGLG